MRTFILGVKKLSKFPIRYVFPGFRVTLKRYPLYSFSNIPLSALRVWIFALPFAKGIKERFIALLGEVSRFEITMARDRTFRRLFDHLLHHQVHE